MTFSLSKPRGAGTLPVAFLVLLGAAGCGEAGPEPVAIPAGFSSEEDVMRVLKSAYEAADQSREDALAHLNLGLALVANDGWELGERSFRNALAVSPDHTEARFQLALTLQQRGDLDGHVDELQRVLDGAAGFLPAHYALGCALLDRGDLDAAAKHFRRIEDGQPGSALGPMGLGLVAFERGNTDEALQSLTIAAKRSPQDQFIRFQLGQAYLAAGDEAKGSAVLRGIEDAGGRPRLRSPGSKQGAQYAMSRVSRLARAVGRLRSGDAAGAVPALRTLVQSDPSDVAAANNLSVAYMESGQLDAAREAIDAAIARDPKQYTSFVNRAACLLAMAEAKRKGGDVPKSEEDLGQALEAIDRAVELAPRFGRARVLRGQLLAALQRDEEAIAAFGAGIEMGETNESTFVDLSKVLVRARGAEAAAAQLRDGIELGGPRLQLRFELCGVLLRMGRGAEARVGQKQIERLAPGSQYAQLADRLLREKGY